MWMPPDYLYLRQHGKMFIDKSVKMNEETTKCLGYLYDKYSLTQIRVRVAYERILATNEKKKKKKAK